MCIRFSSVLKEAPPSAEEQARKQRQNRRALDALDAADGAVVSPQPAPPAYSDNNPFS